ncbi:MAG: hypothetical protein FGM22_09415 [Burkholderiaceae bacterium]|nr:hypothetical protein [Burkholderiaceae bacterium]
MSDSAAVGRIIFRSRLISALLLLIAVGCFFVMAMLAEPSKTAPPAPEPVKTSPKAAGASKEANNKDTNNKDAPATPVSSQDLSEQIKARLSAADYFDAEFYQSLNALQSRLSALNLPETGQAQKQLSALQELEKRLVPIRGLSPTINRELEGLLSRGGALFKDIIPPTSPFVPISNALEKLRIDFVAIQAKKPLDSFKGFQASLKALIEAREKLNDPGLAPEMNERRKAIVARIDSLTVVRRAKDWESATFTAVAVSTELNRIANAMAAPADQASGAEGIGFDQGIVSRIFGALGFIALILALVEVARCDRRLLSTIDLTAVDSALNNSNRFEALQKANEGLPYLQIAAKQISDLGKQLIGAIKRLGETASSLQQPADASADDPGVKALMDTQFRSREIQRSFSVLKEQSIRLSLALSQANLEPGITDVSDKVVDSIEHADSLVRSMQQDLDAAVARLMSTDQDEALRSHAVGLKRDTEALLVVAGQWTRQFDRFNDALADLDRLLDVASSTSTRRPGEVLEELSERREPS